MTSKIILCCDFCQPVNCTFLCVLRLAPQILQRLADADVGSIASSHRRIDLLERFAYLLTGEPFTFLFLSGQAETLVQDALHIIRAKVRKVGSLNAGHLIIREPVRNLLFPQLVQDLGIELCR